MRGGLILVLLAFPVSVPGSPSLEALETALSHLRWIAYAPTNFNPLRKPPIIPSDQSVRADLEALRKAGFNGLITYGSDVRSLPRLARQAGFKAMLLGTWDPLSPRERAWAKRVVREQGEWIAGIVAGNETILRGERRAEELCQAMTEMRAATGRPVSTTETYDILESLPALAACSDFLTVNAHPYFSGPANRDPSTAVKWTVAVYNILKSKYPDKCLLLKEEGLPTAGGEGLSEQNQARYYELLAKTQVQFAYFEAFDSNFKSAGIERAWGLFHSDRSRKPVVNGLPWMAKR